MQALEQWLDVATSGLCESAAERVRAEIGEHYLSAVEAAGEGDSDSVDVARRAVAALGDAKTANRQYRRVLLTEREAKLLRQLTSSWGPRHSVVTFALVAMAIFAISVRTSQFNYLFAAVAIEGVLRAIPISTIRAGWVVRIFRWVNHAVFYAMWFATTLAFVNPPVFMLALWFLMPVAAVHREYKLFVIRRKLPFGQWPRQLRI